MRGMERDVGRNGSIYGHVLFWEDDTRKMFAVVRLIAELEFYPRGLEKRLSFGCPLGPGCRSGRRFQMLVTSQGQVSTYISA